MSDQVTPSYREEINSQIPAIHLLVNLGFKYLSPEEALSLRGGKSRNIILHSVLGQQLKEINSYEFKGKEHKFSDKNINYAILHFHGLDRQKDITLSDALPFGDCNR